MTCPDSFPNFPAYAFLTCPNSLLGHDSVFYSWTGCVFLFLDRLFTYETADVLCYSRLLVFGLDLNVDLALFLGLKIFLGRVVDMSLGLAVRRNLYPAQHHHPTQHLGKSLTIYMGLFLTNGPERKSRKTDFNWS